VLELTSDGIAELDGLPDADGARLGNALGELLGVAVWCSCSKAIIRHNGSNE